MSKKRRLNVHLYVTPLCNLNCKHCYYESKSSKSISGRLLSTSEMAQIIRGLSDEYAVAFDVEGGEFFLRKDISELFEKVPHHYWRNVTVTTNGTADIQVPSRYLRYLDELRISVEGHTDDLQYDIRGTQLLPILRTCSKLQRDGVLPVLRITLHKKNYQVIPEILERFTELGIARFSFYEFQPLGQGHYYKDEYSLNTEDITFILNSLSQANTDKVKLLKLSLSARRIPEVIRYRKQLTSRGYEIQDISGIPSLTVDYNGDLGICPWRVGQEVIGVFQSERFKAQIAELFTRGLLSHQCDYCSAIRISLTN